MAPDISRAIRRITLVLLTLSAIAVEIAAVDTRPILTSLSLATVWIAIATVAAWFIPIPADPRNRPPRFLSLLIVGLAGAPFLVEPLRRDWTGDGYPLELQMVFALRNIGLGLAACSGWLMCLRLACAVSLFLMLFSAAMSNHPAVLVLLGLYTVTGSIWLMLIHWSGLKKVLVDSDHAVEIESQPRRDRLPWVAVLVALGLAGCVFGLIAVGPERAILTLGEWLPTSGGTGGYDPFARGGVNDGDDETKGENAKSTGMTQTETFLESPLPSLYDMANESYGLPHKPKREVEQMIGLDSSFKVLQSHKKPPDNLRPNRTFPTARQSPRKPNTPLSRSARALFEVEGRTPLHIGVVAFDTFDGREWHEAPMNNNCRMLAKEHKTNWMLVDGRDSNVFAKSESHQFKITAPEGSLIPTPPHLTRFRIGQVNRADFFAWSHDGILKFARRKTPSGIVVETECRTVDRRKLEEVTFRNGFTGERFDYATLPPELMAAVSSLAHAWTEGLPSGWEQISAIVRKVRTEYILDPTYSVPAECPHPLAYFLLESRRGPDYQFASAVTVLLRVLGYPTRLVSGFYVHPDHFDPETKHTPVVKEDIHFWPEVLLPSGDWLVIEPTPGYEIMEPNLPLSERIKDAATAFASWVGRNALLLGTVLLLLITLYFRRRAIFDAVAATLWRWFPGRTWRDQIHRTVTLLERRGRWAGRPRSSKQTVAAWMRASFPVSATLQIDAGQLVKMAEWAYYAPDVAPPWPTTEPLLVCQRIVDVCTLQLWRNLTSPEPTTGAQT